MRSKSIHKRRPDRQWIMYVYPNGKVRMYEKYHTSQTVMYHYTGHTNAFRYRINLRWKG